MNKKLKLFIAAAAGFGLMSCNGPSAVQQVVKAPAVTAAHLPAQNESPVNTIPEFTPEEYSHIDMPTYHELEGSENAIADTQITALYKLHAQNKNLDGLPTRSYGMAFLTETMNTAASRADETFPLYANALRIAQYNLARLHGRVNSDTLFQIKMELMVPLSEIYEAETKKYGEETEESKALLYRISYMEEPQLREIIARLEQRLSAAFLPHSRQYGRDVAQLISNTSEYLGWVEGLKTHAVNNQVPHSIYASLDADMMQFNIDQEAVTAAAAKSR